MGEQVVAEPREEIERHCGDVQKAFDREVPARPEAVDRQAILRALQQRLDTLAAIVAGEDLLSIRILGSEIGVQRGVRGPVIALGHQLHQDDAHRVAAREMR